MTNLSVNLNKIALIRNSRGNDFPNVIEFAKKFIELGVNGITVHPRLDERHIKRRDVLDLAELLKDYPDVELNVEGYPSRDYIQLIQDIRPDQCTIVPDSINQLTSDHGWDIKKEKVFIKETIGLIKKAGCRASIFVDPDIKQIKLVPETGADRIELYTESFAALFGSSLSDKVFNKYKASAEAAQEMGIGVNAGHDLNLKNLPKFLEIDGILEVSIGHALTVECIEFGMKEVVKRYLGICSNKNR
ncbi:MAG: pyridoxine 5'-phosphate synthase [Desulfatiglans sp.]|jgi:pyridoxine 5-phosphate synthase|nr:pyridoxine 5'-phosphate synthase [Desulfatiglans sp.]